MRIPVEFVGTVQTTLVMMPSDDIDKTAVVEFSYMGEDRLRMNFKKWMHQVTKKYGNASSTEMYVIYSKVLHFAIEPKYMPPPTWRYWLDGTYIKRERLKGDRAKALLVR